jgi:hypothetical protein
MNMKYQRGRTSFFTLMIWAVGAMWLFGMFDNDEGKASVENTITNLESAVVQLGTAAKRIQKGIRAQNKHEPKPVEKRKPVEVKVVIVDLRNLEPKYIPNRFRDKTKYIQLPLTKEYYPLRHSDGTLWGCKADESSQTICYPVSD